VAIEGLSGVGNGEVPVDFPGWRLAFAAPAIHLVGQGGLGGKAPREALTAQSPEIEFHLVEPRATLGRVGDREAAG